MISCSVGIAMYPDGCSHAKLIARADAAMYASKRAGGSNHCFYSTAMDADAEAQFDAAARPAQGDRGQGVRALLPAEDRLQERQGHRGRGAAALEAPDPRRAAAEHLHPDRRALRPDRPDRQLGDRGRLPAKPRLARQGPAHARRDQPLGAPDAPGRHRRAHHRRAAAVQDPPVAADLRDHRIGGDGGHQDDAGDLPPPRRARHAPLDRRLRHRLLEPQPTCASSRPRS